jgi:hypothetical protein
MSATESKSNRTASPWWLLLMTVLGGAFLAGRGTRPPEDKGTAAPPAARAASESEKASPEDRLQAPLREYLGLPLKPTKAEPAPPGKLLLDQPLSGGSRLKASVEWAGGTSSAQKDSQRADLQSRIQKRVGLLEFLIVTVADPIETATNNRFDLQLDTLHKALGVDGYITDHYYLPWGEGETPHAHRNEPGVLLYRRNGASVNSCMSQEECNKRSDLLLVYLVGETPTSGIHKGAFLAAMRQIKELAPFSPCSPSPSSWMIRVAGPLFTGSADSLAHAIRQTRDDGITQAGFMVITGTAVSVDTKRFEAMAGKDVDFHSTVLSGAVLKKALIDHVVDRTRDKQIRIAWLTETGTGYGSSISVDKLDEEGLGEDEMESAAKASAPLQPYELIEFRFPVNIAKVRSGYAESRRRERSGQPNLGPESSRLPIPFDDTNTARDVPPMQTPKVTAPTVELILGQILATIRNQGIKYVGISSSDARDPIFLAELIKEQCPDVQIMLVTSDLLHLHSEYRSIMHGTLVSSTHPLHPEAQDWCFPFGEEKHRTSRSAVLSSQSHYGLYNAVLFQRGLERGQYRHPEARKTAPEDSNLLVLSYSKQADWPGGLPLGYSMPFQKYTESGKTRMRPPVWISRISSGAVLPINVRASEPLDAANYTLTLQVNEPPDKSLLPQLRIQTHIPSSLYIASLFWLIAATIYGVALLAPQPVGNWAKALTVSKGQPKSFRKLVYVFRSFITGSLVYVLIQFGTLMYVFHRWTVETSWADYLTVAQYLLCWLVGTVLAACLLADVLRALWGLRIDVEDAVKRTVKYFQNRPAAELEPGTGEKLDLSWHLIAARGVSLSVILVLVLIHILATVWQYSDWRVHKEDSFLWFKVTSDMWNGISPAMTAQLLAVALIVLAYGMLLQMHLLGKEYAIVRPDPARLALPDRILRRKLRKEVQASLLFPLLSRWRRNRPVMLDLLCVAGVLAWLWYLGWHLPSPDYCALPASFPAVLLLMAGAFWCVRLFKLVHIMKGLVVQLDKLTASLRERWPGTWPKIFELLTEKRAGLQELFWCRRPVASDEDLRKARAALDLVMPDEAGRQAAEQRLCAVQIDLYVRQYFHHIVRLGFGLAVAACLIFLCAQAFPYNHEPFLRLSASVMLASIGCVMTWYYLKFDRHELLSHLVGTDPKQVSINWSLVQAVAPALLLTVVALLSSAFPEIWQWLRGALEPVARSSI